MPSFGNGRIRVSAVLFLGRGCRRLLGHLLPFFCVGGEQHVVIKAVPAIIAMLIQLEEQIDILR